jgi:hypothetical protein
MSEPVRSEVALKFLFGKRAGMTKEAGTLPADHDCPTPRRVAYRSRQRDWDRVAHNGVGAQGSFLATRAMGHGTSSNQLQHDELCGITRKLRL